MERVLTALVPMEVAVRLGVIVAGILMVIAAATVGPWNCVRVWRDPVSAETMTQAGRVLPFGYATSRGMTRGTLPLWTVVGFFGAGTLTSAALPAGTTHRAGPALILGVVFFGSGFVVFGLLLAIIWFNRPRWLVPSHMRGEDGVVTAWWRCRGLPPAQRRAAARARQRWPGPGGRPPSPGCCGRSR